MINIDQEVDSFNVARRLGKKERARFDGLDGVARLGETLGISIVSSADKSGVDVVGADEVAIIAARFPDLTNSSVINALIRMRHKREPTTNYIHSMGVRKSVELFDDYSGRVALGLPLSAEGADQIMMDRQRLAESFTKIVGSTVVLPLIEEPYLTVGTISSDADDRALCLLADTAASIIWPKGTQAPDALDKVFLFDPEVYFSAVPVPELVPDYFGE